MRYSFRATPLAALAALFILAGCDAATPHMESTAGLTASVQSGPAARATGSGHFIDVRPGIAIPGLRRTFSFTALGNADGSARGQWELHSRGFPARLHGTVECLVVDGNRAWFAGPTTQSDDPSFVGTVRGYYVVDNGQGSRSPADQVSTSEAPVDAQTWCADRPIVSLFTVENGNVQVR